MKKQASLFFTIIFGCVNLFAQPKFTAIETPKNLNDGITDLTQQISKDLSENQKRKIAVVEFVDLQGKVTDFGRYLSEKLITKLFQTKKITVVERQLLNKIITEQKLSLTGIIDPNSAQKLGKLLGVDAIASGSISDLTKTIEINARLISTETGEVFSAASTEIIKDETVCNLMGCNISITDKLENSTVSNSQTTDKTWKIDSNFITFEIKECLLSGVTAVCEFIITNKDKDKNFVLYGNYRNDWTGVSSGTRSFDENNNTYLAAGAEIANSRKENLVTTTLISKTPTKARVYFEGVDSNTKKFAVLQIGYQTTGIDRAKTVEIKFRDVPIRNK